MYWVQLAIAISSVFFLTMLAWEQGS